MPINGTTGLTVATKITVTRILLIPVFVICLVYRRPGLALVVFALASLADAVDGHLARRRGEKTELGAMLDPMADKLLMFSAYIVLGRMGEIPPWLSIFVISRDVIISLGFLVLFLTVGFVTPRPSLLGKATTALQMLSIIAGLLAYAARIPGTPLLPLYILTGGLTVISGLHYTFFVGARMLAQRERAAKQNSAQPAER
ncbi:MAG: CDP-alcohol phosphatidyltransferase family protein [bacterium]|nr:CDP-alcohol phosphatidyltransferase family protein [bacterium]